MPPPLPYLAYGANLDAAVMAGRGVQARAKPRAVRLPNHRVVFRHRGGYATLVEQASGDCPPAEGVLYELTDAQLDDLSRYETGYKRAVIGQGNMVALDDGTPVPNGAVTFVSRWDVTLRCEVPPRATYLRKLQRGAQTNLLSETYRSYLAGVEALPDGTPPPPSYGDSPSADLAKLAAAAALTLVLGAFV